jgi:hypothetical protein
MEHLHAVRAALMNVRLAVRHDDDALAVERPREGPLQPLWRPAPAALSGLLVRELRHHLAEVSDKRLKRSRPWIPFTRWRDAARVQQPADLQRP